MTALSLKDQRSPEDRRQDPPTDTSGMPWWVRAIAYIGVPAAIACYLVYFLTSDVSIGLKAANTAIATHATGSAISGEALSRLEQEHRDSNKRMEKLLEILCVQGARTTPERKDCVNAR